MKNLTNLAYSDAKEEYIPDIKPIKNWKLGIENFYKNKGKEKIERDAKIFSEVMAGFMGKAELELRWDEKRGLDGINFNSQQDLILNEYNDWQEHNITTKNSILGISILMNYYKELSKYIPKP